MFVNKWNEETTAEINKIIVICLFIVATEFNLFLFRYFILLIEVLPY